MNKDLETNGVLSVNRVELYKVVAANNAILTDLITQIKLLDR